MTNSIQLALTSKGWMAKFEGPHAAEIVRLFGSNIIPTAFGSAAPLAMVMREVQARNPQAVVFSRQKRAA